MPRRKVKKRRKIQRGGGDEEQLLQKNPMYETGEESKGSLIPKKEKKTGFNNEKFKRD